MTNKEYVQNLLLANDIIYIDTSSLMNVEEFKVFIESYSEDFLNFGMKITVTREVCLEIVKHLSSEHIEKQTKAKRVIDIFKNFNTIFIFEDENLTSHEANFAFADSELLSRMTKSKLDYKQLLITNDKNLCIDAFNLNTLNSCKGQQIMVCYINRNGKLHKGITEPLEKRENKTVEAYENSFADRTEKLPGKPARNTIKNCFFGACLLLVGFRLGKIVK